MDVKFTSKVHRAKIIATIGPASNNPAMIKKLIEAGATVFRFNLSHKDEEELINDVKIVRDVSDSLRLNIATIADLPGPKIRVHGLTDNLKIEEKEKITILKEPPKENYKFLPTEKYILINYPEIISDINVGEYVYIDDGLIKLKAIDKDENYIICEALNAVS